MPRGGNARSAMHPGIVFPESPRTASFRPTAG